MYEWVVEKPGGLDTLNPRNRYVPEYCGNNKCLANHDLFFLHLAAPLSESLIKSAETLLRQLLPKKSRRKDGSEIYSKEGRKR